jgi:hypothetical protein
MNGINEIVLHEEWKPPEIRLKLCLGDLLIYFGFIISHYFEFDWTICFFHCVLGIKWVIFLTSIAIVMRSFGTKNFTHLYFQQRDQLLSMWANYGYWKKTLLNIICDIPMIGFCFYYNYNIFACYLLSFILIEWIYVKHFKVVIQDELNCYETT